MDVLGKLKKKKNQTNKWEKKKTTIDWINIYRYFKDQNLKEYRDYTVLLMQM